MFPLGAWKSIKEMEDCLTLEELYLLVDEQRKANHENQKFMAALQGVDLDAGKKDETFEAVKRKAEAALAGKSEEEHVFNFIGIEIEPDDDEDD